MLLNKSWNKFLQKLRIGISFELSPMDNSNLQFIILFECISSIQEYYMQITFFWPWGVNFSITDILFPEGSYMKIGREID